MDFKSFNNYVDTSSFVLASQRNLAEVPKPRAVNRPIKLLVTPIKHKGCVIAIQNCFADSAMFFFLSNFGNYIYYLDYIFLSAISINDIFRKHLI